MGVVTDCVLKSMAYKLAFYVDLDSHSPEGEGAMKLDMLDSPGVISPFTTVVSPIIFKAQDRRFDRVVVDPRVCECI